MRIIIDLQGAQSESRFRGIGRYSLSLSMAIAREPKGHEIWLALSSAYPEGLLDIRERFKGVIPQDRIRMFKVPLDIEERYPSNQQRARAAELLYEYFLEGLDPDIVLISSIFDEGYFSSSIASVGKFAKSYKTAAILYDLIPLLNADQYLSDRNLRDYYMRRVESLKKTELLLSISESSKNEAVDTLSIPENKIVNISCAVDESFHCRPIKDREKQTLLKKYGISRDIVLYAPGGFDARKNFYRLMEAYSLLPKTLRDKYQLVIVSKIQESNYHKLKAASKKYGLGEDELVITGYVSNEDLLSLYNTSSLFVFPSLHEGFGLPILEAMSCSLPAIGSNTTSIPEVLGMDEAMFDPYSANSIFKKIREVLENDIFREKLKQNAKEQIQLFSWSNSAKKALSAMENLVTDNNTQERSIDNKKEIVEEITEIYSDTKPDRGDMEQLAFCISANTPINRKKQLFLDISMLAKADLRSGVQRVSRSILSEMLKMTNENFIIRPIYYDEKDKRYRYADKQASAIANVETKESGNLVVDFRQGDIYLSLDITAHLTHILHGFYIYLRALGVKVYTLIYDILFANHPHWWVEKVSKNLNVWFDNVVSASTGLICISDAVANDVGEWIRENPPARPDAPIIKSFHLGADIENSAPSKGLPKDADTVLQLIQGKPSFLMVGTVEPRKGHYQTLKAFETLWAEGEDINLIIVGKEGWLVDKLVKELRNHPEKNRHLFWLEGISDEYLEKIYAASTCLIAASLGEGFGLPLIEAAQNKLPIIARDIPVFREVAGDYAYYFDNTDNAEMLADTIKNWVDQYRNDLYQKSDNMPWLTWKESARQLLEVINDLDQQVDAAKV